MNSNDITSTYQLISNYKDNELFRNSYNELTRNTYGFDFEAWYQYGYWSDKHIPYSLLDNTHNFKMIANASINIMEFHTPLGDKTYLQIGTVMTDSNYRKKGLSRYLLEHILREWEHKTDGIFLFANDSVLDFYPKFGFKKCLEYQYSKDIIATPTYTAQKKDMTNRENQTLLFDSILNSKTMSKFAMLNNPQLIMFYVTSFMKNNVYYIKELNAYAIIEKTKHTLILHDVFVDTILPLDIIINALADKDTNKVVLNFTPMDTDGYRKSILTEEDTTLYVLGKDFDFIEKEQLMFPSLSHT